MKPTVAAGGLATKTQNKLSECVSAERQSYVHEEDVLIAFCVRIFDGVPDGDFCWMQEYIRLPAKG